MKLKYENTTIAPEKTKFQIEKVLKDHGVTNIAWLTKENKTILVFEWKTAVRDPQKGVVEKGWTFQFSPPEILVPKRVYNEREGRVVRQNVRLEAAAWRLLLHYLENKLEAVRLGMESMEKEFLSHAVIQLENGRTSTIGERINEVYETISKPSLSYQPNHASEEGRFVEGEVVEKALKIEKEQA